jgi:5-amino-6-(5-phosphoribosylamino)uracil reductase
LDDKSEQRLLLSNEADFDLVDRLRSNCDAILVGANTVRKDNPSLKIKNAEYQKSFYEHTGRRQPIRLTCTNSCNLDVAAKFFSDDFSAKIVFCRTDALGECRKEIDTVAEVIELPSSNFFRALLEKMLQKGVSHLLVEGGASLITQFIKQGLFDDLIISLAPVVLGKQGDAFFIDNSLLSDPIKNLKLMSVKNVDGMVLSHYANNTRD